MNSGEQYKYIKIIINKSTSNNNKKKEEEKKWRLKRKDTEMKFRMGSMTVEGANPIGHLLNRQIGNNIYYFRRNLFRERLASARNLYRKNLVSHYGCVNAIEFSNSGDLLVSGKPFNPICIGCMCSENSIQFQILRNDAHNICAAIECNHKKREENG